MKLAVLILAFNRPKEISILFEVLSKIKPKKIYINQDGPRKNNENDLELCKRVQEIAINPNWDCEVFTNFNASNKGCRSSVSNGIKWFFESEREGIILEDDCIPSLSFFSFCEKMLNKYEEDKSVHVISGSNFQKKKIIGNGDYYFSKYAHCWGWATWKQSWENYDDDLSFWNTLKKSKEWRNLHKNKLEEKYWVKILNKVKEKKIDSWAYVWQASIWNNGGFTVTPNINLVRNIGFNEDATHTISSRKSNEFDISEEINEEIIHPQDKEISQDADRFVFYNHFNGKYNFWPWKIIYLFKFFISEPKAFMIKLRRKINL